MKVDIGLLFIFFVVDVILFLALAACTKKIYNFVKRTEHFNLENYLPEEEVHSLRQIFYLILMTSSFVVILNVFIGSETQLVSISIFDLLLSLYFFIKIDKSSWKGKILAFLVMPIGSMSFLLFENLHMIVIDFIHVLVFIYLIKKSYDQFSEYTQTNGLGLTIVLLFVVIFVSLFTTAFAEGVNLLDALIMASNAFTSNGYVVSGHTLISKLDSLLLAWGGYILSGVGTATLAAGILIKHFNKRFDELERLIEESKKE